MLWASPPAADFLGGLMNNFDAATPLKSQGVSRLLMQFLWANLSLAIISLIFSLLKVIAPTISDALQGLQEILLFVALFIGLVALVLWLVWLYRLHVDLKVLFKDYPITPGGALARFLIPIYSFWGIWNTLSTFGNTFKQEGGEFTQCAEQLDPLIGGFYALTIGSNILNREMSRMQRQNSEIEPFWFLVSDVVSVFLSVVVLQMVKVMKSAIAEKARQPQITPSP